MRSIGEIQNIMNDKVQKKKEYIERVTASITKETKTTLRNGMLILWYGLCSSIVIYMAVRAVMFAL